MPAAGSRKPDHLRNASPLKVYMPAHEREATVAKARSRAMTTTTYVRAILAKHHRITGTPTLKAHRANAAALRELSRVGNNLNQLVRLAHEQRAGISPTHVKTVLDEVLAAIQRL